MSGLPWGKFWWKDWLADPALSVCSLAAQGLWMRMLCIMSMCEPPGHFSLPPTRRKESEAKQVARMCLADARQVRPLLEELETRGVSSRNDGGTIISRRMIRDAKLVESGRATAEKRAPTPGAVRSRLAREQTLAVTRSRPSGKWRSRTKLPPKRPRASRSRDRKQGNPACRNANADILREELEDGEAGDARPRRPTMVLVAGRAVRG